MFAAIRCNPQGDEIVALGTIFFRDTLMGRKGYIEDVVVNEDHRGMGYAKSIGKRMDELARKRKARKIELRSGNQRKKGHGLWLGLKFKPADSTPFDLYLDI